MSWLFQRHPVINFYKPDADTVWLVVEGFGKPRPMKRDHRGNWSVHLQRSYRALHGRAYHFKIRQNANTMYIADPLARGIEHNRHGFTSRFRGLSYRWKRRRFQAPPLRDIVIYETHLPALSRHPSAKVLLGSELDAAQSAGHADHPHDPAGHGHHHADDSPVPHGDEPEH